MKSAIKASAFILLFLLAGYVMPADAAMYHFGSDERQLSSATDEVADGYYDATTLTAVDTGLAAGNIKNTVNIFGIVGTYEVPGGTNYGLPKTGQTISYPNGDDTDRDDGYYEKGTPTSGDRYTYGFTYGTGAEEGTVTDNGTGLMWITDPSAISSPDFNLTMTWEAAITNCEVLVYAGHSDWRLPNINELITIVNWGAISPAMYIGYFANTTFDYYWSSTTCASDTNSAWRVYFGVADVLGVSKTASYHVRPVRGGKP
jgi:hypothetical protein